VYVAKIEKRKGQYKYQSLQGIDFVGNYQDSDFDTNRPNYLGEWDKQTLYKNLTNYGNLVLLSEGEADPLVVKEGLIAGLGVVVSECASANLDLTKPFITVIPHDKLSDLQFVYRKILENRLTSIQMRQEIHEYAMDNFAWGKIIEKYIETCL
jgi:glycosyltransferase involved in cell wall biosynthesis